MDSEILSEEEIFKEVQESLSKDICLITNEFNNGNISKDIIEFIAERNEEFFEIYLEDGYEKELWLSSMKRLIKDNKIYPCLSGAALHDMGIKNFLDKLHKLTFTAYSNEGKFKGRVYKVRHDEQGNKITYIKALGGSLKAREAVTYGKDSGQCEKVSQIRFYNSTKFKTVEKVEAGELFAVTGLSLAKVGYGIGDLKESCQYEMVPTLKSKVIFNEKLNTKEVLVVFKTLEAEDPALNILSDERLKEIQVHIMGVIQLEVLKQVVKERFNLDIEFGPCEILYKEYRTIKIEVKEY